MKIIRPEYTPEKPKETVETLIIDNHVVTPVSPEILQMSFEPKNHVEELMKQTIEENKIKVEFTLTKRQYELWLKRGSERWLKKLLVGQVKKGDKKC